jgi:hypothetical protein
VSRRRRVALVAAATLGGIAAFSVLVAGPPAPPYRESPLPAPAAWAEIEAEEVHARPACGLSDATAYSDGFVLVGGELICHLSTGQPWSDVEEAAIRLEDAALVAVATGGERLVAIELIGGPDEPPAFVVWTSPDAATWTPARSEAFAGLNFAEIEGSAAGFLVRGFAPGGGNSIFLSRDGVDWEAVDPAQFGDGAVGDVAAYRGGWLAVGAGPSRNGDQIPPDLPGRAWWSADGITWHRASISDQRGVWLVLPGAGGVLAVGSSLSGGVGPSSLHRSSDGRTWDGPATDPYPHQSEYLADGQRIVRWAYQDDRPITWSTDAMEWHTLDERVSLPRTVQGSRLYLGPSSLLLTFVTVADENAESETFVQLFRVR